MSGTPSPVFFPATRIELPSPNDEPALGGGTICFPHGFVDEMMFCLQFSITSLAGSNNLYGHYSFASTIASSNRLSKTFFMYSAIFSDWVVTVMG